MMIKQFSLGILSLTFLLNIAPVLAGDDDDDNGNNACPVDTPYSDKDGNAVSFATKFGADVEDSMRCNKRRHKVKLVVQVNDYCRDRVANINACNPGRAFALGNMKNMINDYEITHGMERGRDYKMIAVVHSGGGHLLRKYTGKDAGGNPIPNPYTNDVKYLLDNGVDIYFCLNTGAGFIKRGAFSQGNLPAQLVDERVKFVPAGLTSIVDFQNKGYKYVQP